MKVNLLCPFIIRSFYLRRLDAGGEELDEFGAVGAEGVKGRGRFDKLAVAEKFKPVFGLSRFLERNLELRCKV